MTPQSDIELASLLYYVADKGGGDSAPNCDEISKREMARRITAHCQPLRERIVKLEKALEKYGRHGWNCAPLSESVTCSCGLDSALKKEKE